MSETTPTPPDALLALPISRGMRRKGTDAVVGIIPNKIAALHPTAPDYLAEYEEVPLYSSEQLNAHADARVAHALAPVIAERDALAHEVKAWRDGEETRARTVENFHARAEAAEAERDALREALMEMREWTIDAGARIPANLRCRIDAALNASAAKGE